MATEKQIAANRANAKLSTGPKTTVGKMKSSRNAFRHGLSGSLPFNSAISAKVDSIVHALVGENASEEERGAAVVFARAQLELLRIRSTRIGLAEKNGLKCRDFEALRRMAALDRYERYSLTKWRRASRKVRFARTNPI